MAETASNEYGSGSGQTARKDFSSQDDSMIEQAKHKAQEVKQEAGDMLRSQGDRGATQAGDKVLSTAHDMRNVSDTLRDQGRDSAAKFVEQGAFQAEKMANYLRTTDMDTMMNDFQDYARRQPWVVALGGLALGFVAARLLKASGEQTYRESHMSNMQSSHIETRSRHLSAVPGQGSSEYERGSGYETGGSYGTGYGSGSTGSYGQSTGSFYGDRSTYESGTLGESASEQVTEDEEDDYRTGQAGAGGRPF